MRASCTAPRRGPYADSGEARLVRLHQLSEPQHLERCSSSDLMSESTKDEGIDRACLEGHYGFMKRATITETKNGLSRLLEEVRRGETILITQRKVPIARIEPVRGSAGAKDDRLTALIGEGIVSPPQRALDVSTLRKESLPMLLKGDSAVTALLADREGSP